MKISKPMVALMLSASVTASAECYNVICNMETYTESDTRQGGDGEFVFYNKRGMQVGRKTFEVNAMITGEYYDSTLNSQTLSSNTGDFPFTLITVNDLSTVVGDADTCSIPVSVSMTRSVYSDGLFLELKDFNLVMDGDFNRSNKAGCEGLPNVYEITGEICLIGNM